MFIPLTVGGGVRTVEDVRRLLNAGADKVSFNSAAVADPQVIRDAAAKYGAQCIVVAIDAKRRAGGAGWEVYTHGGRTNTGLDAVAWARRMAAAGAGEILLTSMDRDGTRSGFDLELTRAVSDALDIPVIASGGVGTLEHLADGIQKGGADAVLAASIFHYGEHTVAEAKALMAARGIPVRAVNRRALPHEVRIIGGRFKRSKLPVADRPGLRPTPDRVRETLFNWLGQDLSGWRCLDAFAGSGALGFEAASRGALRVVLLERDARLVRALQATQQRLQAEGVRVERADALAWMARSEPPPSTWCCSTRRSIRISPRRRSTWRGACSRRAG